MHQQAGTFGRGTQFLVHAHTLWHAWPPACPAPPPIQAVVPRAPIRLDRAALRRLGAGEVLLRRWPSRHLPAQWFRIVDPEAAVVVGPCGHFFEADEFEMVRGAR